MKCMYLLIGIMLIHPLFSRKVIRQLLQITIQSVLQALSAVFESIIKDHLISYLLDNDLICIQQLGFMQGRSTCLQLLNVSNDLMEAWTSYTKEDVIYLDFVKAFDIVPHEQLLH